MENNAEDLTSNMYQQKIFVINDVIFFEPEKKKVYLNEDSATLSYVESKVLSLLISNINRVVTKNEVMEHSWEGRVVTDSSLAKAISNIRKVLKKFSNDQDIVQTIPRIGYRLSCSVSESFTPLFAHQHNQAATFDMIEENAANTKFSIPKYCCLLNLVKSLLTNRIFNYVVCGMCIIGASYNISYSIKIMGNHINPDYEYQKIDFSGRTYKILSPKSLLLTKELKDVLSQLPNDSLTFIDKVSDDYYLAFEFKGEVITLVFDSRKLLGIKEKIKVLINEIEARE
ncbi:winged helix-turn-helix domain-containing protein [Aeromonas veronii]|nr:winged helix-turn-helix domain-containing protein [Aeromonas veronii]